MAKKNTETTVSQTIEKPDTDSFSAGLANSDEFLQKNRNLLAGAAIAIVVVAAGIFGYNYYRDVKTEEAQNLMYPAVYHFEADSLKKALDGDGANEGLLDITDDYGMTKAGNLANFYVGVAFLKQGKYDQAIERLKDFSSSDLLVQARAYALLGDAYMEKGNVGEAINYYQKAVDYKPNKFFTPGYLMKLALAQETNKDVQGAIESYQIIIDKYGNSGEAINAKKYKSKLEGLAGK
jgi:TolA-binding protein